MSADSHRRAPMVGHIWARAEELDRAVSDYRAHQEMHDKACTDPNCTAAGIVFVGTVDQTVPSGKIRIQCGDAEEWVCPSIASSLDLTVTAHPEDMPIIRDTVSPSSLGMPTWIAPKDLRTAFVEDATHTRGECTVASADGTQSSWLIPAVTTAEGVYRPSRRSGSKRLVGAIADTVRSVLGGSGGPQVIGLEDAVSGTQEAIVYVRGEDLRHVKATIRQITDDLEEAGLTEVTVTYRPDPSIPEGFFSMVRPDADSQMMLPIKGSQAHQDWKARLEGAGRIFQ